MLFREQLTEAQDRNIFEEADKLIPEIEEGILERAADGYTTYIVPSGPLYSAACRRFVNQQGCLTRYFQDNSWVIGWHPMQ